MGNSNRELGLNKQGGLLLNPQSPIPDHQFGTRPCRQPTTSSSSARARAAGTLAYALRNSGAKVLLIERGDYLPQEPENWEPKAVFDQKRYKPRETWLDADNGKPFEPGVHYFIGGNTKVYGAALPRFRQEDFGVIEHEGGTSPAWPSHL